MILVDDQSGSQALYPYINKLVPGSILTRITPPVDICWVGNGPDESALNVGVEYKKIDDVLTCMIDGRFTGKQLIDLMTFDRRYLLVEYGRVRIDRVTGNLQKLHGDRWYDVTRKGRSITYRELEHWYTTIEEQTQTRVVQTYTEYESARWVQMKHSWYVNKGWDEHTALKQFHVPAPPSAMLVRPGLIQRVAKELPNIGWEKSIAVTQRFKSVLEMVLADQKVWEGIDGIGRTIATRVVKAIRGEN